MSSKLEDLFSNEEKTMEHIYVHVCNGGSLIDLCKIWEVPFGSVMSWIRKEDNRNEKYNDALMDRLEWAKERVLVELRTMGLADVTKIFDKDGEVKSPTEWPKEITPLIKSYDVKYDKDMNRNVKVAFWNKEKALELLGKNMAMFIEKVEVGGKVRLEDIINDSQEDDDVK